MSAEHFGRGTGKLGRAQRGAGAAAGLAAERADEPGAPPGRADPAFARDRLVDDAEDRPVLLRQRDQGAEDRAARDKGAGAVDRVEHPAARRVRAVDPVFLALDSVAWEPLGKHRAHRLLGAAVGDRDRAAIGFDCGADAGAEKGADHRPGHVGRRLGRGEQRVEVGRAAAAQGLGADCGALEGAPVPPTLGEEAGALSGAAELLIALGFPAGAAVPGADALAPPAAFCAAAGSGTGLFDSVRRYAITSARVWVFGMPA